MPHRFTFSQKPRPGATVRRATDNVLDRVCAVKTSNPDRGDREITALKRLSHHNVVRVHDRWTDPVTGMDYLVMEWIEGETLRTMVPRLAFNQKVVTVRAMLAAVGHCHEKGVVHRDIKPDNVMIEYAGGRIVLVDFDVAKSIGIDITGMNTQVGTPAYMSPEAARGLTTDSRADLWGVALTAYQLFTGVCPFRDENEMRLRDNIVNKEPELPSAQSASCPRELDAVLLRGLAKSPDARFQTAGEFDAALARALGLEPRMEATIVLPRAQEGVPRGPVEPAAVVEAPVAEASAAAAVPARVRQRLPAFASSAGPGRGEPRAWFHYVAASLIVVAVAGLIMLV